MMALFAGTSFALATPAVRMDAGVVRDEPVRGSAKIRKASVALPRTWMRATDALIRAHQATGLLYALVPAEFHNAPVGPFQPGKPIEIERLAGRIAEATGTRLQWVNDIAVFDPPAGNKSADASKSLDATVKSPLASGDIISALDQRGDSGVVAELTRLAGSADASVRLNALAALQRMEGDFMRGAYPGRVSILEVLADRIDRDALLYALEEGGPVGGRNWKLAVELLGRARTRVLSRYVWNHVWQKTPGTMEIGLWAIGRCGDPAAGWSMRGRVRETASNDPSHRYLAAMALGLLNGDSYMKADLDNPNVEVRRATAFGLGFCGRENGTARKYLVQHLADADPAVRALACHSLARTGAPAAIGQLQELARAGATADMRVAAIEALVAQGCPEAVDAVAAATRDSQPTVRAQAARLLAETGGDDSENRLLELAADADRWVRCAAIEAVARRGTGAGIQNAVNILGKTTVDADHRIAALLGLGRSLAPEAAAPLTALVSDLQVPEHLRRYALLGLLQLAQGAGRKAVSLAATTINPISVSLATRHLELDTPEATASFLIPYLTHAGSDGASMRTHVGRDGACAAAGRLAELGYGPGVIELLEGSDVFDNHTRMMHMWGAVRAPGRESTLALAAAAQNRRGSIRRAAALALGGRIVPESVAALLQLARDPETEVRATAAQALGATAAPAAVATLCELALHDPSLRVAIEAGRALRGRDFRHLPQVKEIFRQLVGTPRDPGLPLDQPDLDKQPGHSCVLRAWADHVEEDLVANLSYESSLCYDAHNRRVVMWGAHGRRCDTPQTGQTWFYDTDANQWTRLTKSRHWPNGACCIRGTAYDDANRVVISPRSGGSNSHGWHNALRANLSHTSPWVLDVTTDQWYAAAPLKMFSGGFVPGSHDPVHGVTFWWKGSLIAFDVYANRWSQFAPEGAKPESPGDTGGVFDPATGRFIAVATTSTWAFDPARNAWTDLRPDGPHPPPCPMVYDAANDVMLAFRSDSDGLGVWVYHLRANRWERLPSLHPAPSHVWDAAYDPQNNVVVFTGENSLGWSATLTRRETWTYRYKAAPKAAAVWPARDLVCATSADGTVTVSWTPSGAFARNRVERGAGAHPWLVKWEQAGEVAGGVALFSEKPSQKELLFYRVIGIQADGTLSRPSMPGRTVPRIVRQVAATARGDGAVRLCWTAVPGADIAGYHVYRVPVSLGTVWTKQFNPENVTGTLVRVTDKPVSAVEWVDEHADVKTPADAMNWPASCAYVVRPVNAWGLEGGLSPLTLALPDPPGPVQVVPWADGRRLVLWNECFIGAGGYHLMRMDDWHAQHVFRLQAAPLTAPFFLDGDNFPTGDRRRYFASGVDALGATGIPTSGAWSHGYP